MSAATDPIHLPRPSTDILANATLFLDFDGTLVDIADRPDAVIVGSEIGDLLTSLLERHEGRVALVSGRSLAQLDALIGPAATTIAVSASHGCEHRWDGLVAYPVRPTALDVAAAWFKRIATTFPGTLVEEKTFGVALHYRLVPHLENQLSTMAGKIGHSLNLTVQEGKMVVELRMPGGDKGTAVRRMMARASMAGSHPIFIGDDVTDEPGFEAVQELGGTGIFVGSPRRTSACCALPDPASVRSWLSGEYGMREPIH